MTNDTNDVEKRWHDPAAFRAAVTYVVTVVAVAGVAFVLYAVLGNRSLIVAATVPTTLLIGGIGAFVKTYRVWRTRGTWVIWQGAGWFLMSLMVVCLAIPGSAGLY